MKEYKEKDVFTDLSTVAGAGAGPVEYFGRRTGGLAGPLHAQGAAGLRRHCHGHCAGSASLK